MPQKRSFKRWTLMTRRWASQTTVYRWFNPEPAPVANEGERAYWAWYLGSAKDAQIHTATVAEILLREVKYVVDSKIDLIKSTDGKAATQVTILGGGLGILSILGATRSEMVTAGNPWLLGLATTLIILAAAVDLGCLASGYRYTSGMPTFEIYNSRAVLDNRQMAGRVGSAIVERYVLYSNALTALNARKSRLLKVATYVVIAGVVLLVLNAAWTDMHPSKQKSDAACHFSARTINCILEPDEDQNN
jgi:hypothetical protein